MVWLFALAARSRRSSAALLAARLEQSLQPSSDSCHSPALESFPDPSTAACFPTIGPADPRAPSLAVPSGRIFPAALFPVGLVPAVPCLHAPFPRAVFSAPLQFPYPVARR